MIDIVNQYSCRFNETVLITGRLIERGDKLNDGVKVLWIKQYKRTSLLSKVSSWFSGFIQALYLVGFKYKDSKLFIVSNPPFAIFIPLIFKRNFSLLIFDVYPDALINSISWFRYTPISYFWGKLNTIAFNKADRVYTIGDGLKQALLKYVHQDKIDVVPLWTDNKFIFKVARESNIFLKNKSFENKFIVLYSGNLGKTQNPEVILNLALHLRNEDDIHFVIIGNGSERSNIENKINSDSLNNVSLFDWQEPSMLSHTFRRQILH